MAMSPRKIGEGLYQPLAEINVTPLVDVMLVLLIIFMVTAPMLAAGIKVNLPSARTATPLEAKDPVVVVVAKDGAVSVGKDPVSRDELAAKVKGKVFIADAEVALTDLIPKLKAITDARGGLEERIYLRADKKADYGTVAKVMGLLSGAGFKKLALVTEADQGS